MPKTYYCGFSVKRPILGFIATAVALMILFAPGPSGADGQARSHFGRTFRAGRVLAPAFDAIDIRDQDIGKLSRDSAPTLLVAPVVGPALITLFRRIFTLTEPPCGRWLLRPLHAGLSRAPPSITL
jgi:hypothetical protein